MRYFIVDTWNKNALISEHFCWVRAGKEARRLDKAAGDRREMKATPDRYDVVDADLVPLRKMADPPVAKAAR